MFFNFLMFVPGAGGNFLTRTLTLSEETVPLGRGQFFAQTSQERYIQYSYNDLPNLPVRQGDWGTWWAYELKNQWPITRFGIEGLETLNLTIIEPLHPRHFEEKIKLLGPQDKFQIFEINIKGAEEWLLKQMLQKTGGYGYSRRHNLKDIAQERKISKNIRKNFAVEDISLQRIIESKKSFYEEYNIICDKMNITACPLAKDLYEQWIKTWG